MGRGGRSLVLALGQGQLLGEEGAGSLQTQDGRPPGVSVSGSLALNGMSCLER